jgi:hypothetical protein
MIDLLVIILNTFKITIRLFKSEVKRKLEHVQELPRGSLRKEVTRGPKLCSGHVGHA